MRITPACAGKSFDPACRQCGKEDHPRVCGEKCGIYMGKRFDQGSPPRVRGKADPNGRRAGCLGITPACAGKRIQARQALGKREDHPRVCGEKAAHRLRPMPRRGSPPRVRGKDGYAPIGAQVTGITPACAGKSSISSQKAFAREDHPRVCGEKMYCSPSSSVTTGSPPRVRGKAQAAADALVAAGITPACAGKRPFRPCRKQSARDHPRVCGEKQGPDEK